jgi:hypothetical protein
MPYLGYTLRVPSAWERVVGNAGAPVPSIASIADRDQVTAQALVSAAQHIAADGGLLDPMGIWAVDPASLLQFGVLAGQPYRISVDDLRTQVDQSLTERASEQGDRTVDPVAFPVGSGFRTSYLDAVDLAQHVEYHLRTDSGRYLVAAASFPGLIDPSTTDLLDRVVGSIAPIPGSAGDRPAPSPLASSGPAADLLASIPGQVGAIELERHELDGESLVASSDPGTGSLASALGVLLSVPADLTLAIGVPKTSDADLLVAAYELAGVDQPALDAVLDTFPTNVWARTRLGPTQVLTSVRGAGGRRSWLWSGQLPSGDAVLYQVEATNGTLARAAITAMAAETRG